MGSTIPVSVQTYMHGGFAHHYSNQEEHTRCVHCKRKRASGQGQGTKLLGESVRVVGTMAIGKRALRVCLVFFPSF
jgi:hypothetical protein